MNDKLNMLERKAIASEHQAENYRWKQAEEIVRCLETETEREIAAGWVNGRTGKAYGENTVHQFAAAWRKFARVPAQDRPAFWKATEEATRSSTRVERNEAQAPRTEETARKLAQNIVANTPPEVQAVIAEELVKAPETERSLRRVAEGPKHHPRQPKPASQKLGDAVFLLWEVSQLVLEENPTGEEKVRLMGSVESAKKIVDALSNLLDTGTLDAEFKELLAQMGEAA